MPNQAITSQQIRVRQVTHYHPSWTNQEPGAPGTFTIQLLLDQGAEEYVIRPTAEDMDVLVHMLRKSDDVYFDLERKVLMFGTRPVG